MNDNDAIRLAAPAPQRTEDDVPPGQIEQDRDLDALCDAWAHWCRTRRFYGPAPMNASVLGKLSGKSQAPREPGGPDAPCSAELAALHLAVIAQPREALDRKVFELHYLWSVRNIKAAAAQLGISRQHWYRLLGDFRRRVYAASLAILQANSVRDPGSPP